MQLRIPPKQIFVLAVVAVVAVAFTWTAVNWANKTWFSSVLDTGEEGDTTVIVPDTTKKTMLIQFAMKDILNSRALKDDVDKADVFRASSPFNFLSPIVRAHDVAAATEVTDDYFAEGDLLIFHCYSDEDPDQESQAGTNYYDSWFVFELKEGEKVYWLDYIDETNHLRSGDKSVRYTSLVDVASTSPFTYTLKSNWKNTAKPTGYTISITGGTTPYWDVGVFKLWPRLTAAHTDSVVSYSGTVLDKVTDGAANTTEGADGVGTAPTAVVGKTNTINIALEAGVPDCGYGKPMIYITSQGELTSREAFLIVYFNQTTIGHDYLVNNGWKAASVSELYAGKAYYWHIPGLLPVKNSKVSYSIPLYIDTTDCTASQGLSMIMLFGDGQDETNIKMGVFSTANPTFYGMSDWGLDSPLQATGITITTGEATSGWLFPAIQNSA
jgi:hypothetical protein